MTANSAPWWTRSQSIAAQLLATAYGRSPRTTATASGQAGVGAAVLEAAVLVAMAT